MSCGMILMHTEFWKGSTMNDKHPTFLVTAVGGDVGASVVRCLRDGYPDSLILGSDMKPYVQSADTIDALFALPSYRDAAYITALLRICEEHQVSHLIPVNEGEISVISRHLDQFLARSILVVIHPESMIHILQSKHETANFLAAHGISAPKTWLVSEKDQITNFPLIAKLDHSAGGRNMILIHSKEQLDATNLSDSYILQQQVGTETSEYTMTVFSDGCTPASYICYRRQLGMGSMSVFVETVNFDWLQSLADKIADCFSLRGSLNIQFRIDHGQYYIFEINARFSSTVHFRHLMHFTDVLWWVEMLSGHTVHPQTITSPFVGVKQTGELIFPISNDETTCIPR